jgi:hypothetical protein
MPDEGRTRRAGARFFLQRTSGAWRKIALHGRPKVLTRALMLSSNVRLSCGENTE